MNHEDKGRALRMAARYLGLKGALWRNPETGMEALLEKAYQVALEAAEPRHCLVRCPVRVEEGEGEETPRVFFGALPALPSRHLARLLAGCREGYALLATLGMKLDLTLRRLMVSDPALAAAAGACGSALIEVYIDGVLRLAQASLAAAGEHLTPRFSPGYGDVPLTVQPGLIALCKGSSLGVYVTQANQMIPEKSVSAVMGITREKANACLLGCSNCGKRDCPFREEEA
ncbi:MAG: hypothetical protein GXY67_07565 [Clostridiales bacterium]|nr:hypothetical protein [Clostridiales bacterium]